MFFKSLKIICFGIHESKIVHFKSGVNIIAGETGRGKSTIIRALNWLIHNKPLGADKIFQNKRNKTPLQVTLEDGRGNVVTRNKGQYTLKMKRQLKGIEFKAFNKDVPSPIKELLPLKPINWNRQIDPHYLILDTPGNAAKVLHKSMGIDDQELIIKEIKTRLSDAKSEIKRLTNESAEHRDLIDSLKPIKPLLKAALEIEEEQKELEELENNYEVLVDSTEKIELIDKELKLADISSFLKRLEEIYIEVGALKETEETIEEISELIEELQEIEKSLGISLDPFLKIIQAIEIEVIEIHKQADELSKLSNTVKRIKQIEQEIELYDETHNELNEKHQSLIAKLKICPVCNKKM